MRERIDYICGKEGVGLEGGAFELLAEVSEGDLRKAVTTLQSAVRLAGSVVNRYGERGGGGYEGRGTV
jgi:replication factor C subunit 2/4